MAEVAEMLGQPLMPWQRYVADVALEIDPATGRLAYREVNLTVPRQSGKTLLLLCVMVHRALGFGQRQRIIYTAQTRNDARKKWEDEHVEVLKASPLRNMFSVRFTNGNEAIKWKNGSSHGITSTTEKAGHGETLDAGVIDEAFAHEDARIEQGLRPTMITRPQPQLWVVSTAGTVKSAYLRGKVDAGRQRIDAGAPSSVAYFEWSAPDNADPADPITWQNCMPALGHTINIDAIRAELEGLGLKEFRRAYLNQWPDAAPEEWEVIPRDPWLALEDKESSALDPVCFAIDTTPDRTWTSIAIAGQREDGNMHGEVIAHEPGTGWVVDWLTEPNPVTGKSRVETWKPCAVVIDAAGPAGSLIGPLEAAGVEVSIPTSREAAQAAGQLYDAVKDKTFRHLGQAPLNSALAGAVRRPLGDSWAFGRKGASVDISPVVAVCLAAWGHTKYAHLNQELDIAMNVW